MNEEKDMFKEISVESYARGLVHGFTVGFGKPPRPETLARLKKLEEAFLQAYERIGDNSDSPYNKS